MATIKGTRWSNLPDPSKYDIGEVKKDVKAGLKALNPPETAKGSALEMVEKAGLRGGSRLLGAAGEAAGALGAGYLAGRGIDNMTGLGKDLVNKTSLGKKVDELVNDRDKVTLTKEAQERVDKPENEKKPVKRSVTRTNVSVEPAPSQTPNDDYGPGIRDDIGIPREAKDENMKRGGKVKHHAKVVKSSASRRADGIATKGHTKGRMI